LSASFRIGRGAAGDSWRIVGPARVDGALVPPGDKSIAHRAVLLAALGRGATTLRGLPSGDDVGSTLAAVQSLGVAVRGDRAACVVTGGGLAGLHPARVAIDCGNSGTTMRLLSGILAAQPFASRLTGDASLERRPMRRVVEPLVAMGARIDCEGRDGRAPLRFAAPPARLHGRVHRLAVDSAQVRSAILFAGLYAGGPTRLEPAGAARDHTERMLGACGVRIASDRGGTTLQPTHGRGWSAFEAWIPGDVSSAMFWIAAVAARRGDARLIVERVGLNPGRVQAIELLVRAGARIEMQRGGQSHGEPWGTIVARGGGFAALRLTSRDTVQCLDEIPALAAAAAMAGAALTVRDAGELRVKESDRIAGVVRVLTAFGARARARRDGLDLEPGARLQPARVSSAGDHRLAMMAAMLALSAPGESTVGDIACVRTSYPEFAADLRRLTGL
jgi:3-phosphoshikimate 1-carboxyvinyltransferase